MSKGKEIKEKKNTRDFTLDLVANRLGLGELENSRFPARRDVKLSSE